MVTDAQLVTGAYYFAAAVSALCALLGLVVLLAYRPRPVTGTGYLREVPDELPLAVVGTLLRRRVVGDTEMTATLLDLAARGLLEARSVRRRITGIAGGGDVHTLEFSLKEDAWERMTPLEQELFGMLAEMVGGRASVGLADLKAAARARTRTFRQGIARWQASVDAFAVHEGLLRTRARSARSLLVFSAAMTLILGAFASMVASSLMPAVITAVGASLAIGATSAVSALTKAGAQVLAHYRAFERYLNDFGTLEDDPPESLEIWSRYLAYAALFGIAEKALRALDVRLPAIAGSPDLEPFRALRTSR